MRKKFIIYAIGIVCSLIILAIIGPSALAKYSTGLDTNEQSFSAGGPWNFKYGHSSTYGVYVRDIQWDSDDFGDEIYISLLSVPWVDIDGDLYYPPLGTYSTPSRSSSPSINPTSHTLTYSYTFTGTGDNSDTTFTLVIQIQLIDGGDASITITSSLSISPQSPQNQHDFMIAVRADIDISDASGGNGKGYYDDVWEFVNYEEENQWKKRGGDMNEYYFTTSNPYDTTDFHSTKVRVQDSAISVPEFGTGPTAAIAPSSTSNDVFYVLQYNVNEFTGNPGDYINSESRDGADIVIWDLTETISEPGVGNIAVNIWVD